MLKCNTLIINSPQKLESGNIPVNIGDNDDIKVEGGEVKVKNDEGNWVSQTSDINVKVEDGLLKYKDSNGNWSEYITTPDKDIKVEDGLLKYKSNDDWVTYNQETDIKVEDGEVVIKDESGKWNNIKGNKYSKIKIDDTKQSLCYSKNVEYEILFNYVDNTDSDSVINYDSDNDSLTFNEDGVYVIHYNVAIENLSSKSNNRVETYIKYNGGGDEIDLADSFAYGWVYKKSSGVLTLASSCVLNASIGDNIKIIIKKSLGNGYFSTLQNGVSLIAIKIN